MEEILKYFPHLSHEQRCQFEALYALYTDWNAKINVVSRKDIENLYLHHVLHSLAIAKVVQFRPNTHILDLGCGGGFPGIPLAIFFPDARFHLVDSIGKKLKVAQAVAEAIQLHNVEFTHARGEDIKEKDYDFVVSRAVMPMVDLVRCVRKNIQKDQHNSLPNGIIALKGGELDEEIASLRHVSTIWNISDYFSEGYFQTKKIVHVVIR